MKYFSRFFILFVFIHSFCLLSEARERTTVILRKNTVASLDAIVSSVQKENSPSIHTLHQLYLDEGAILYTNGHVIIHAKKVTLKPKSVIHTLGHSIEIKADIFEASHLPLDDQNLTLLQKLEYMGRIDTRFKEEDHHGEVGDAGNDLPKADSAQLDCRQDEGHICKEGTVILAREGKEGESGKSGGKGQDGGAILLTVSDFRGGYFITLGGKGGRGGKGGKGQQGGDGFIAAMHPGGGVKDGRRCYAEGHKTISLGQLVTGAKGGRGGRGGKGGDGGKGGSLVIRCEKFSAQKDKNFFVENQGGEKGDHGDGGEESSGGQAGISGIRRHGSYETEKGQAGANGLLGLQGESGNSGQNGILQIFNPVIYEKEP